LAQVSPVHKPSPRQRPCSQENWPLGVVHTGRPKAVGFEACQAVDEKLVGGDDYEGPAVGATSRFA
jgi:hypothetical protein